MSAYGQVLDYQADRIEDVLFSHKLPSRVYGGMVTPRFVRFRLALPIGAKVRQVSNLTEEIALSLGVTSCRIFRQGADVNVEVPRQQAQVVHLPPLCRRLPEVPPHTAVLGLDDRGAPLLLRLSSPEVAHVLIAGTTGSGKTELARCMIASLALLNRQSDIQMVLIDPKGQGFAPFDGLAHLLCPVVRDAGAAVSILQKLVAEMERRDREACERPRVVVFVDELADLVYAGGKEVENVLTRLVQRGRGAGIHVVACTQKPTAAIIGSLVKSNFPVRLVGSVTCPEDAKVASGIAQTGADRLLGRGDFILVAKGQVMRLQGAYITREEISALVRRSAQRGEPLRLPTAADDRGWMPRLVQKVAGGFTGA